MGETAKFGRSNQSFILEESGMLEVGRKELEANQRETEAVWSVLRRVGWSCHEHVGGYEENWEDAEVLSIEGHRTQRHGVGKT